VENAASGSVGISYIPVSLAGGDGVPVLVRNPVLACDVESHVGHDGCISFIPPIHQGLSGILHPTIIHRPHAACRRAG
jgi:hypothetical protein